VVQWVGAILGADEGVVVSVTQHQCGDPDCGGSATTILVAGWRKDRSSIDHTRRD
jgi:hypothetical protein